MTRQETSQYTKKEIKKINQLIIDSESKILQYLKNNIPDINDDNYQTIWNDIQSYIINEIYSFFKETVVLSMLNMFIKYHVKFDNKDYGLITNDFINQLVYTKDQMNPESRIIKWVNVTKEKQILVKYPNEKAINYLFNAIDRIYDTDSIFILNNINKHNISKIEQNYALDITAYAPIAVIGGDNCCGGCPVGEEFPLGDEPDVPSHEKCHCYIYYIDTDIPDDIHDLDLEIEEVKVEIKDCDTLTKAEKERIEKDIEDWLMENSEKFDITEIL